MRKIVWMTTMAAAWIACGGHVESTTPTASPTADGGTDDGAADIGATGVLNRDAGITACGELADPNTLAEFGASRAIGLFEVVASAEECNDLGGVHVVFRPVKGCGLATELRIVEWGGHGCISAKRWQTGELAVLAVDGSVATRPAGVCLDSLPSADGTVRAIQPVSSTHDGDAVLAKYGCGV